jgi:hypothetical protein
MSHENDPTIPFRGRAEIADRLEIGSAHRLLLAEAPNAFAAIVSAALSPEQQLVLIEAREIRSVKDAFDWILLWQESRVGSHALLDKAVTRLAPGGRIWVVTALRKVQGPRTPAAHRLEAGDIATAFAKKGLEGDREARLSAWHVAYRFARTGDPAAAGRSTRRRGKTDP